MAIKLLESINSESNDTVQYPDDGAPINFLSAYKKNGRIFGASVTINGKVLTISKGLLIARGFRLAIDGSTVLLDLTNSAMPASQTTFNILISIIRTGHNATFSVSYRNSSLSYSTDAIDQDEGTYELKIGILTLNSSGIVGYADALTTIAPPSSSDSSSGVGSMLPPPELEIVSRRAGGAYGGYLAIRNKGDYSGYATKYSVRFQLFRFMRKAKYRERSGSTKVYLRKSAFVQPAVSLGWGTAKIPVIVLLSDLQTVTVTANGTFSYIRKDIVCPISNFVTSMFYVPGTTKTAVTNSTNVYSIRSTRSEKKKTIGQYGKHAKHNFFIFAYKVYLYSGSARIAESPFSKTVVITPNYHMKVANGASTGIAGKFRILIE
jgi:hypothetical protein